MKKVIVLILVFCALVPVNYAEAKQIHVTPQMLTSKQSRDYKVINDITIRVFKKLVPAINTNNMIEVYDNFPLVKNDGTQNPDYYYVRYKFVDLLYSKETNQLEKIAISKNKMPECWVIYDYPSGEINSVEIHYANQKNYVFTPDGKYVDMNPYMANVAKKISQNVETNSKLLFISRMRNKYHKVEVQVVIGRDGNLKKCEIVKSSHISTVDEKALNSIRKSAPFEKFPDYVPNRDVSINYIFNLSAEKTAQEDL